MAGFADWTVSPLGSLSHDLSASDTEYTAGNGTFTRSTVCVKSPIDSSVAFTLLSLGRQQNVSFQTGDSLHGDSKRIHVNCYKEFVIWAVFSLNCSQNI